MSCVGLFHVFSLDIINERDFPAPILSSASNNTASIHPATSVQPIHPATGSAVASAEMPEITVVETCFYNFKPFSGGYEVFSEGDNMTCGLLVRYPDGSEHDFMPYSDDDYYYAYDYFVTDDGKYLVYAGGVEQDHRIGAFDLTTKETAWSIATGCIPVSINNYDDKYCMIPDRRYGFVFLVPKTSENEAIEIDRYGQFSFYTGAFANGYVFSVGTNKYNDDKQHYIKLYSKKGRDDFQECDKKNIQMIPGSKWGLDLDLVHFFLDSEHNTVFLHDGRNAVHAYVAEDGVWRDFNIEGVTGISGKFVWNDVTYYVANKQKNIYFLYWDGDTVKMTDEPVATLQSNYYHCSGAVLKDGKLYIYECKEPK